MTDMGRTIPELADAGQVTAWLASKGWSEASGGNFSVRISNLPEEMEDLSGETPQSLPFTVPALGGETLLISARGGRARDFAAAPRAGCGIFWILGGGEEITCLWGNNSPTSELAAHLAVHEMLVEVRPTHRAILHTHPANLIAITHDPELVDERRMSDLLLRMQSEARLYLPEGLGRLKYHLPGSRELGEASAAALRRTPLALWQMHGAIATGETLSNALDLLEIVEKAAEVYLRLRAAGIEPTGMTDEHLALTLRHFGLWDRYADSKSLET